MMDLMPIMSKEMKFYDFSYVGSHEGGSDSFCQSKFYSQIHDELMKKESGEWKKPIFYFFSIPNLAYTMLTIIYFHRAL